jgi:hypothetical protein
MNNGNKVNVENFNQFEDNKIVYSKNVVGPFQKAKNTLPIIRENQKYDNKN